MRLIDADALKEKVEGLKRCVEHFDKNAFYAASFCIDYIDAAPTVADAEIVQRMEDDLK